MPLKTDINKVLIIGSGPNIVGSVAELDVMATEAIKAFLEDDVKVVLVNPNPATIQTDPQKGVTVYLEPMTLDFMKRILRMEEPDALITAFGSSTALKITHLLQKDGILDEMQIELLTMSPKMIELYDSHKMADFLEQNSLSVNPTHYLNENKLDRLETNINNFDYPVWVTKQHEYSQNEHFKFKDKSSLIDFLKHETEQDRFDFKDYSFTQDLSNREEVIVNVLRDSRGNFNFFNFSSTIEPVSISAGDSAIVSPVLTMNNDQQQTLRALSKRIMNRLDLVGALNIHFAIDHRGTDIDAKVLSIVPVLTRSSLLAVRVGIYDVGYILGKIALGYNLNEIIDPLSGLNAAIEPIQDSVAIRLPYWSFTEAGYNHYQLSSKNQASGEAIGIGRNFEIAFLKALSSTVDFDTVKHVYYAEISKDKTTILNDLKHPDEFHFIRVIAALYQGLTYNELHPILHWHPIYLQKLQHLVKLEFELEKKDLTAELLLKVKKYGFSNRLIAEINKIDRNQIDKLIKKYNIHPSYIALDGTAGLLHPRVSAVYSAYGIENEIDPLPTTNEKVLVIGMRPIQVSLTSEFDYMIYHSLKTLHQAGIATILISNNPEAVSTSYLNADRIYFEPITLENIISIAQKEGVTKVITQFAGKEINALRKNLIKHGLIIIGQEEYKPTDISLERANANEVPRLQTENIQEALSFAQTHDFPILIGGRKGRVKQKSAVVYDMPALEKYIQENELDRINISRFISGKKYEITAISDGVSCTIPGIIEHLEQSGSHASDSIAVFQPQNLSEAQKRHLRDSAVNIISQIKIRGILNLHFLFVGDELYCLQIKTYAGHNIAFLSKSLRKDIIQIATKVLLGTKLSEMNLSADIWPTTSLIHVKMPVFSLINYQSENTFDSKMKSSGSVMGRDTQLSKALYKGYEGSNLVIPSYGTIFISVRDKDKKRTINLARRFHRLGFKLVATEGTAMILAEAGITTGTAEKVHEDPTYLLEKIAAHKIVMVINITNLSDAASQDAIRIKDQALSTHIPVFSSIETAELILEVLESLALTTQPI